MPPQTLTRASEDIAPLSSAAQDRLWISQTLTGEPQAYANLINKHKDRLFELTCRVLKDRSQGEDILQNAFVQGYQHLRTFRHDAQFSTWIYSIVLNGLRNHLRRNKVIRWSSLDAPRRGPENSYIAEIKHHEPSMDTVVEGKMDIELIRRLMTSFRPIYQTMLDMHYFQHLSLLEIAAKTGRPLGTVKVYLHRARKQLCHDFKNQSTSPILNVFTGVDN